MAKGATATVESIEVLEVRRGKVEVCILGTSPIILNRMSQKAREVLLLPRGPKSAAEKKSTLKHNPPEEFRASAHTTAEPGPTRLLIPGAMVKGAIRSVALDMPGASKAEIGRQVFVENEWLHLYGVPEMFMAVTRSADMKRTPDIRTRAIVPRWACRASITFVVPLLTAKVVMNLLAAAGIMRGLGDWRPEKGSGSYGQFELVSADHKDFLDILKNGGRQPQDQALADPACYDAQTAELLSFFVSEAERRGRENSSTDVPARKRKETK